ncbi:MAG: M67 family peptidase [Candidatus Schekmanbacteria bacterium]|nr:MAG: M67 family peptidase [Candidatus Schekmanbacteria bacterium]
MLSIPSSIYDKLIRQLKKEYPYEGCGALLGKDGRVTEIVEFTNIEKSPTSFQCDPYEQLTLLRRLEEEDIDLLCLYHSHPEGECKPSEKDIRLAQFNCYYLIVLLKNLSNPKAGLFSIKDGRYQEEKLVIE